MFGNIRKKINSALNEGLSLPDNLSASYLKTNQFDVSRAELGIPSSINLHAGCNILHGNEETWKHLHEGNEINAEKAERTDASIQEIKNEFEKLYVHLTELNACLITLPQIRNNVNTCMEMINSIKSGCISFENQLVELENLSEEVALQERKLGHQVQMTLYKQKKMAELEKVRQQLAEQHDRNVRHFEDELKQMQQERQAVFQDAFQQDLEIYKQEGYIPRIANVKNNLRHQQSLEEIVLDDGESKEELENFLKD